MKNVFAYVRVSTTRQGEGVSMDVQRESIERYAAQNSLNVVRWFEEKVTAAKKGRAAFSEMMKLLRNGKADGVVIHKIDRSARNLSDWADLGGLIDKGVSLHFAHESLDLHTRGGRLSADIQAIIAADYVRNLRQEAVKGIYGRLKQGFYPFHAPVGYVNNGQAKYKTFHPVQAPLVRQAFELYATKKYSLETLLVHLAKLGLRNVKGGRVTTSGLSTILNNPFYMGIIRVKGQSFNGGHEPLVEPSLFKRVQAILRSNASQRIVVHDFLYRKLLRCARCGRTLTGELQKGAVYYRCHTKACPATSLKERTMEKRFVEIVRFMELQPQEVETAREAIRDFKREDVSRSEQHLSSIQLQKVKLQERIERITDMYIEQELDKETFYAKKAKLLEELKDREEIENSLLMDQEKIFDETQKMFELLSDLTQTYQKAILEEKREMIETMTSNLSLEVKKPLITMRSPFSKLLNIELLLSSGADRDALRNTASEIVISDTDAFPMRKPFSKEQIEFMVTELLFDKGLKSNP